MELIGELKHYFLGFAMIVMALALFLSLLRAMAGPRFTDRIVAINMIGTQAILMICILSYMIGEQYLVDVAIVYAMISFLAVVALVNIYLSMLHEKVDELRKAQDIERREHAIELGAGALKAGDGTETSGGETAEAGKAVDTGTASDKKEGSSTRKTSDVEEKVMTADTPAAREIMEATGSEDEFFDAEDTADALEPGDSLLSKRKSREGEETEHDA